MNKNKKEVEKEACQTCEEHLVGWKRALADYDNLQKNLLEEKSRIRTQTKVDLLHQLLPIIDNFEQAVKFQPKDLDASAQGWLAGILHVKTQLEEVFKDMGAVPVGAVGDPFDPNLHEAVENKEDASAPDQTLLEVINRGWKVGDQLIRPAKVVVNSVNS